MIIKTKDGFNGTIPITNPENLKIAIGKNNSLIIEEIQFGNNNRNQSIDISIGTNSSVNYKTFQNINKETENNVSRKAILGENSSLTWLDIHLGSKLTKLNTETYLNGENSATETKNLFLGKGKQQFDITINSFHKAKNTNTNIITKSVLKDQSKSLVQGLIKIEGKAGFSHGSQKEDALLLSEQAEANAIPNLEVENHEVKCKHSSSIGRLDKNHLFYLQSKGLSEEESEELLVQGFIHPILKSFDENIQEKIQF